MMPRTPPAPRALMLLPLVLLLTGCAHAPPNLLPAVVVPPPQIPPLPREARQPPLPAWCSPTCSAGLTTQRESWLRLSTEPLSPAEPANGPTTR